MVRSVGLLLVCLCCVGCPKEESEPQCNQADGTGFGLRVEFQGRVDGEGGTATGGASMFVAPAAAVTVPLAVREQFEVSPSSLTFTPENWDVPQTVTVRAKPGVRSADITSGTTTSLIVGPTKSADPAFQCQYDFTGFIPLPRCGDAIVDPHLGETCESPGSSLCPLGQTTCEVCGQECKLVAGVPNKCGDGVVTGGERCDGTTTTTCAREGFTLGTIACAANCQLDTSGCVRLGCDGGPNCETRFPTAPGDDGAACLLGADGRARCWGASTVGHARPPDVTFRQLADGRAHGCGVTMAGDVRCWGDDTRGQATPPRGGPFTQVVVGHFHSCALSMSGTVQCWGSDEYSLSRVPSGGPFVDLTSGANHVCALTSTGVAKCWGRRGEGQTVVPTTTFTKLASSANHACGLSPMGGITCWGNFGPGREPLSLTWPWPFIDLVVVAQDVCGLSADGRVVCAGLNTGDLALPDGFVPVSLGDASSGLCALDAQGQAVCWGVPEARAPLVGSFSRVDTGFMFCGVRADGTAACGSSSVTSSSPLRQLVFPNRNTTCTVTTDGGTSCPMRWMAGGVAREADAPRVAFSRLVVFDEVACGLRTTGSVVCWGNVENGGTGVPVEPMTDFAHNGRTGCGVLASTGALACWGTNPFGIRTPPSGAFTQVRMNRLFACALRVDGRVACWGESPVPAPEGQTFTALAMGEYEGLCGLQSDGGVPCWGRRQQRLVPRESFAQLQATSTSAAARTRAGSLRHFDPAAFEPDSVALVEARVDELVVGQDSFCARHGAGVMCLSPSTKVVRPLGDVLAFGTDEAGAQCWLVDGGLPRCNFGVTPPQEPLTVMRLAGRTLRGIVRDGGGVLAGGLVQGPFEALEATAATWCARRASTGVWECSGVRDAGLAGMTAPLERLSIARTEDLACGIADGGAVSCWGRGLGRPMASVPAGGWSDVRLGRTHGCGLRPDASVQCWGEATDPTLLAAPGGAFDLVGSGDGYSCARRAGSHELVCWGRYDLNVTR